MIEENNISFSIKNGYAVVPIGMDLNLKLDKGIKSIRFEFDDCDNHYDV